MERNPSRDLDPTTRGLHSVGLGLIVAVGSVGILVAQLIVGSMFYAVFRSFLGWRLE